jgi:hypothetical protein
LVASGRLEAILGMACIHGSLVAINPSAHACVCVPGLNTTSQPADVLRCHPIDRIGLRRSAAADGGNNGLCDTKPYLLSAPSAHPQRQHRLYFFGAGEKVGFVMVVVLETPEKTFSMAHIELQLSDDESGGWR